MANDKIDIVIPWVDSSDPLWQTQFKEYVSTNTNGDCHPIRYRDWELMRYWFRGIEQFMPWVGKIHFVTCGHLPEWIDLSNPKLNWVKHDDFIPSCYLPTFSANTIELNLHRIKGLSDRFIYFNDDIFVLRPIPVRRFFRKGLPCDLGVMTAKPSDGGIIHMAINDLDVIDKHFSKRRQMSRNFMKWFNIRYGIGVINNILLAPWRDFSGFIDPHLPNAYLKSTFEEVWAAEPDILEKTCLSRFRSNEDVNQWLFRYWQLAKGDFHPADTRRNTISMDITDKDIQYIVDCITGGNLDMICLNDNVNIQNFDIVKKQLVRGFEMILPKKSAFEI